MKRVVMTAPLLRSTTSHGPSPSGLLGGAVPSVPPVSIILPVGAARSARAGEYALPGNKSASLGMSWSKLFHPATVVGLVTIGPPDETVTLPGKGCPLSHIIAESNCDRKIGRPGARPGNLSSSLVRSQ